MIKIPFYILSILSAFLLAVLVLVSCGAERNFKRAERHLALGEYFDAANEYKQAYQKTPPKDRERRALIASKMAFCYDKSLQTGKAVAAYRNVIRYKQANMEEHLALARQLMKEGSYAAAEAEFKLVLDSLPDNTLAKEGLIAAKMHPEQKKREVVTPSRRCKYSHLAAPITHQWSSVTLTTSFILPLPATRLWATS